jgi:hypothetical protein
VKQQHCPCEPSCLIADREWDRRETSVLSLSLQSHHPEVTAS